MGALFPGARVSLAVIGSPARVDALTSSGDSWASRAFCASVTGASRRVVRCAELRRQSWLARVLSVRAVICRQQVHDRAVLVSRPHRAVVPQEAGPALSSPPKQHEPSNRPDTNHLKPTGTS